MGNEYAKQEANMDMEQRRYASKEAALAGHAQVVAALTGAYI